MKMEELVGKTFVSAKADDSEVKFYTSLDPEEGYVLNHEQDCCEDVGVESIVGDLDDLVGTPILDAKKTSNRDLPPKNPKYEPDSYTWTFYDLRTIKGSVQIRFYGESNGYYSEDVSLGKIEREQ